MLRITLRLNDVDVRKFETNSETITIGRGEDNDLQVDNLAVSKNHARLKREDDAYVLYDMDSTNGTYIGKKKISKHSVKDGDAVTIGKHTLLFEFVDKRKGRKADDLNQTMILETQDHASRQRRSETPEDSLFQKGPVGLITIVEGTGKNSTYELRGRMTVFGKDPTAKICLKGLFMPDIAGFFYREKKGYDLMPPEKKNKLKLNGKTVDKAARLQEGDVVEVAGIRMAFSLKK